MKQIIIGVAFLSILLACEDSTTEPSSPDIDPSTLSVEFTGNIAQSVCEITTS